MIKNRILMLCIALLCISCGQSEREIISNELSNGTETEDIQIKLPEKDIYEALNVAHKVVLNGQLKNNKIIDLRIKNHLIVK